MTYSLKVSSLTIVLQCPPLKNFILFFALFPGSATDKDSFSYFFPLDFYNIKMFFHPPIVLIFIYSISSSTKIKIELLIERMHQASFSKLMLI